MSRWFSPFAHAAAQWTGSPYAFIGACTIIILWLVTGPIFHFSTEWQLYINSGTTIVTFLMVFLIQNATNAGDAAAQVKLDALLKTDPDDHDDIFIGIEDLTEPELAHLKQRIREEADAILARRKE